MFKVRCEEKKIGFLCFVCFSIVCEIYFILFIYFLFKMWTREPVGYKIDLDSVNDDSE